MRLVSLLLPAASADRQATQFTRAALRRAGIDADRASADVMDAAFDRIGQAFDNFGATAKIQLTRKFGLDLMRAFKDYRAVTGDGCCRMSCRIESKGRLRAALCF